MNQHMAHTFDVVPVDFIVSVSIFFGQHENGFTDDFDMFHETIKHNGVGYHFFVCMCILTFH